MLRFLSAVVLTLAANPAQAAVCAYSSGFGYGTVTLNDADFTATYDANDGSGVAMCGYNINDETANELMCESGAAKQFALQPSSPTATGPFLMVMDGHIWYPVCE